MDSHQQPPWEALKQAKKQNAINTLAPQIMAIHTANQVQQIMKALPSGPTK
jgi:hypothetical protein